MKQYVRIYYHPRSGRVTHVHTQETPIDFEPVEVAGELLETEDLVLDDPSPDPTRQSLVRARNILNNVERSPEAAEGRVEIEPDEELRRGGFARQPLYDAVPAHRWRTDAPEELRGRTLRKPDPDEMREVKT